MVFVLLLTFGGERFNWLPSQPSADMPPLAIAAESLVLSDSDNRVVTSRLHWMDNAKATLILLATKGMLGRVRTS